MSLPWCQSRAIGLRKIDDRMSASSDLVFRNQSRHRVVAGRRRGQLSAGWVPVGPSMPKSRMVKTVR
jgi:hypothetical protein